MKGGLNNPPNGGVVGVVYAARHASMKGGLNNPPNELAYKGVFPGAQLQ